MNKAKVSKSLAVAVILLFIGVSVAQSIGINVAENNTRIISSGTEATICRTTIHNGSLSGYVNDTCMNPIEEALVRVYFHGTYEENYTDSSGYYHVTNIPLCWCPKNATASKEGYKTEWVWLIIRENTTYDFVLTPINSPCYPVLIGTMGENGWYVSCVTVSFVYDPEEIVELYYYFDDGVWMLYTEPFMVCEDGEHTICWYYVDNEGNQSAIECIDFKIDQTAPMIHLFYKILGNAIKGYKFVYTGFANDATSGVERVEFYRENESIYTELVGIAYDEPYECEANVFPNGKCRVEGLILLPLFYDEYVSFFAVIVKMQGERFIHWCVAYDNAGNSAYDMLMEVFEPSFRFMFQRFTFLNNYSGDIGLFFIDAVFEDIPIEGTR